MMPPRWRSPLGSFSSLLILALVACTAASGTGAPSPTAAGPAALAPTTGAAAPTVAPSAPTVPTAVAAAPTAAATTEAHLPLTVTPAAAAPVVPSWAALAASGESPSARRNHTLTLAEGQNLLLLFGGRAGGTPLGDLWQLDLANNTWTRLAAGPSARFGHVAAYDAKRERLLIWSGQGGSGFFDDTWAYDLKSRAWRNLNPAGAKPAQRYGSCAAIDPAGDKLYVSHGFASGRFNDTWAYDLAANTWTEVSPASGERPIKRCLHRCTWDPANNRLQLMGGQTDGVAALDDVWAFDPRARAWQPQTGAPRPPARNFSAAVVDPAANTVLLFGGQGLGDPLADTWSLNLRSGQWSELKPAGSAPSARHGHDAVYDPAGRRLILFGGAAGQELADLWVLKWG